MDWQRQREESLGERGGDLQQRSVGRPRTQAQSSWYELYPVSYRGASKLTILKEEIYGEFKTADQFDQIMLVLCFCTHQLLQVYILNITTKTSALLFSDYVNSKQQ